MQDPEPLSHPQTSGLAFFHQRHHVLTTLRRPSLEFRHVFLYPFGIMSSRRPDETLFLARYE